VLGEPFHMAISIVLRFLHMLDLDIPYSANYIFTHCPYWVLRGKLALIALTNCLHVVCMYCLRHASEHLW